MIIINLLLSLKTKLFCFPLRSKCGDEDDAKRTYRHQDGGYHRRKFSPHGEINSDHIVKKRNNEGEPNDIHSAPAETNKFFQAIECAPLHNRIAGRRELMKVISDGKTNFTLLQCARIIQSVANH